MTQNKYTSTILDTICNINAIGKEGVDFFIESVPGGGSLFPCTPPKLHYVPTRFPYMFSLQ